MSNQLELELYNKIKAFILDDEILYFFGSGQFCKFILEWFESKNLKMPIAIFDKNKDLHGKVICGVSIVDFNQVYNSTEKFKVIITDLEHSDDLYPKLIEYLGINQVFKISQYFNKTQSQPKTASTRAEFNSINKIYTNSLRGLNNNKFQVLQPTDIPEHAKLIVKKLEYFKQSYLTGENFYINKEKTMLLQDFCSRGYYNGVRRIGGYQSHLIGLEISLGFTFKTVIENSIENICQFSKYLKNKNIPFMYMQLPCKLTPSGNILPEGVSNISNIKSTELLDGLKYNEVDVFDYREFMIKNNIDFLDSFFKTDHHWKPITSLEATIQLLKKIEKLIEIDVDWAKLDIKNYDITTYPSVFLGSQGGQTGVMYSGLDDLDLILPKFDTHYTWSCPEKNFIKHGSLKEALLYPLHLDWNFNILNPYVVYSLISKGYTIIKNHKINNNLKILCLNDSFSNPLSIFLSSQFSESHFLDLRGEQKDLFGIIHNIKPDIVVMLYTTFSFNNQPQMTDVNPNTNI